MGEGDTVHMPGSTTILGALKVTGKTNDGLSVGILQSFTQKEHADVTSPLQSSAPVVEPFGSYTVARVQKDWGKGNTILGGMLTSTHRAISDPALAFLPTPGGVKLRIFAREGAPNDALDAAERTLRRILGGAALPRAGLPESLVAELALAGRTLATWTLIQGLYLLGVPTERLAARYPAAR